MMRLARTPCRWPKWAKSYLFEIPLTPGRGDRATGEGGDRRSSTASGADPGDATADLTRHLDRVEKLAEFAHQQTRAEGCGAMTGRKECEGLLDAMSVECQFAGCTRLAAHAMAEVGSDQDDAESLVRLLELLRARLYEWYEQVAGAPYLPLRPGG